MAKVTFTHAGDTLIAYLSGEIDHHPAQLVLDFGGVDFMDSSGVGLILGRAKQMQALEGRITVQKAPPAVAKMLRLARIESI